MRFGLRLTAMILLLLSAQVAYAAGFDVAVRVTDRLSPRDEQMLKDAGCPLADGSTGSGFAEIVLRGAEDVEVEAAQQALKALASGAKGAIFKCGRDLLVKTDIDRRPYRSRLAGTLAVLAELLGEVEAGSAREATVSGVKMHKVKTTAGGAAYFAFDPGRKKVALKLGEGTWRVASLVAGDEGKMRRVFRKGATVEGTLTPAPVMFSSVGTKRPSKDESAKFWESKSVHKIHLSFSAEAWRTLQARPKEEYVKAVFECDGKKVRGVGVRFKGNSSMMAGAREGKFPFKIDFDRFKDQTFAGMKKLNLSNGFKDPSSMREFLAYELFNKAGLCAGRAAFAEVRVTVEGVHESRYLGLYTAVEQVDATFLRRWFGNAEGTLYKPEVMGTDPLAYRGNNTEDYRRCELKSGEIHADYDALIRLAKLCDRAPDAEFEKEIPSMLDVDSFLKFIAVNALLANYDSYIGTGHNFYLYYDAPAGKFAFIPWDLNEAFGMFTPRGYNPENCAGVGVLKPVAMGKRALVDRILKVEKWRKAYEKHLCDLAGGMLAEKHLHERIDELAKRIKPSAQAESERKRREFTFGPDQLKRFIKNRNEAVLYELMMR